MNTDGLIIANELRRLNDKLDTLIEVLSREK